MEQGFLFEPSSVSRRELQEALERFDSAKAQRLLHDYSRMWPDSELQWEAEVVQFISDVSGRHYDLDSGYALWQEFSSQPFFQAIPSSFQTTIRQNFFSRLLAQSRRRMKELNPSLHRMYLATLE